MAIHADTLSDDLSAATWVRAACITGKAQEIRHESGASLDEVAREIGCTPSTVMRWEKAESRPTGKDAVLYARVLRGLQQIREAP